MEYLYNDLVQKIQRPENQVADYRFSSYRFQETGAS